MSDLIVPNNAFDNKDYVEIEFFDTSTGTKVKRTLRPVCLIPFIRTVSNMSSKYGTPMMEIMEKAEEHAHSVIKDRLQEMKSVAEELGVLIDGADKIKDEKEAELVLERVKEQNKKLDSINREKDAARLSYAIANYLALGEDFIKDALVAVLQDSGVTSGMVHGLTVPKLKELINKFWQLNQVEELLQNPMIQKLKSLSPL